MNALPLLLAAALALGFVLAVRRAAVLAVLTVDAGRARFKRGRLPPRAERELLEILADASAPARVLIVLEGGQPRVVARGLDEGQVQRLRNVVGQFSVVEFRSGRRPRGLRSRR